MSPPPPDRPPEPSDNVRALESRGVVEIVGARITYRLAGPPRSYRWTDPEERVRANTLAFLIVERGYPAHRIKTEVLVPRRTPGDFADLVVFLDDACRSPYLVVENKAGDIGGAHDQPVEQLFGNANSLRSPFALYDTGTESRFFDVANYPPTERTENLLGDREAVPGEYGHMPEYRLIAHTAHDIAPVSSKELSNGIRHAHSIIWAGGRRDPFRAFEEWSKLLFAKVLDERLTPTENPRRFQVGRNETTATVATRIHALFRKAVQLDPTVFPPDTRIELPDRKVVDVVRVLENISFTQTDLDSIGFAFETFFGSVFRGELGQYFTMRPLARFIVAALDVNPTDTLLDPTAGSGGFLLEALLQVWRRIARDYAGATDSEITRLQTEFAQRRVFGIEIHETLARICRINLMLHHDGHTNIEGGRSCLDTTFRLEGLARWKGRFSRIVGNPPFGDGIRKGDQDALGGAQLGDFEVAAGRTQAPSEHVILERAIDMLKPGGRLGFVVPDGLLNNAGVQSNCPRVRQMMASRGRILAIVSLPDHAFRRSGAQNKTSILLFEKFTFDERERFSRVYRETVRKGRSEPEAVAAGHGDHGHGVFLGEARDVGYSPTGVPTPKNDLYRGRSSDHDLDVAAPGTILGEYRRFVTAPAAYVGASEPRTLALPLGAFLAAHPSGRLDPKYHIFKDRETRHVPVGWMTRRVGEVMRRRLEEAHPESEPERVVRVLTISQTGELSERGAGKGRNPPEWRGMYFADSPSRWFVCRAGDVVFSSIDLWKGCIAVVPPELGGALVTREFPAYEVTDARLAPEFLSALLRSRHYLGAFGAITTGHSNRRRTQAADFESLMIAFPPAREEQMRLVAPIRQARKDAAEAAAALESATADFDAVVTGIG